MTKLGLLCFESLREKDESGKVSQAILFKIRFTVVYRNCPTSGVCIVSSMGKKAAEAPLGQMVCMQES